MNSKKAKKIRQLYRRNMGGLANSFLDQVVKKPPFWIPGFLWYRAMKIFVRIDWEKKTDAK